jgi:uncharacterized UPF0160 family protein
MKKIITHNANFHADDVFATATIQMYLDKIGERYKIIRTRDEEIIEKGDFVLDVGGIYDEDANKFDHHQESFKEVGLHNIPYSSFGLVWKQYGKELCENKNVWKKLTAEFVTQIDATDNGVDIATPKIEGLLPVLPNEIISSWMPPYSLRTEETLYEGFLEAVEFAKGFLERQIAKEKSKEEMRDEFEHALKGKKNIFKTDSLQALVLPKPLPWRDFLDSENDFEFIISERDDGKWMAQAVPVNKNSMKAKVVKKSWAGLRGQELCDKVGVPDLVFYHKTGYILVAETKEAIVETLKRI